MQVNCIAKLMQLENELRAAQESCLFLTVKYAVTTEARAINLGLIGGPESRQRLVEMEEQINTIVNGTRNTEFAATDTYAYLLRAHSVVLRELMPDVVVPISTDPSH